MNKETKKLLIKLMRNIHNARVSCILEPEKYSDNLESWLFEIEEDFKMFFVRTNTNIEIME